jgi:4-hydroxybenzoyl-CoA thioesterase
VRWIRSLGFASELDVGGAGLIMADAAVVYRAEGKHGMELRVDVALAEVGSRGFDLVYRLVDEASASEIAQVKTGMVWFDYAARKVRHAPEAFANATRPVSQ